MYQALKELIGRLVDQFADPYAFLREIVQNSLDAGSQQVDFDFEFQQGTTLLTCQDTGEGMDEHLIDTRLTRIFSSSKEDDLTKIGQFGIGFLSLFALKPDHVVVDTGRNGGSWRIHFSSDHSFSKTQLTEPVDGTRIRWVKRQRADQHEQFVADCRKALSLWCRHAQAEIRVQGSPINQAFEWGDGRAVHHQQSGTRVSVRPGGGWLGLYNQGLTLSEGVDRLWPGLDVKISSRYLEHTLTRDRVVRNENFAKARQIVEEVVRAQLLPRLLSERDYASLAPLLGHLNQEQRRVPLVGEFSLEQLAGRRTLYYSQRRDQLVERLSMPVLLWNGSGGLEGLLEAANPSLKLLEVHEAFFLPEILPAEGRPQTWLRRLLEALTGQREFFQAAWLCDFPANLRPRAWLPCYQPREPVPVRFEPREGEARQLLLNVHHPAWGRFWDLDPDEWGVEALFQPLWTCFPQLAPGRRGQERLLRELSG